LAEGYALIPLSAQTLTGFNQRGWKTKGAARTQGRGTPLAMIPNRTSAGRFSIKPLGLAGPI
jgi:hypothetical protein